MLLYNLDQSADIDVVELVSRQIDERVCVDQLHVVLPNQFKLHHDNIVFNILQVDVLVQIDCWRLL